MHKSVEALPPPHFQNEGRGLEPPFSCSAAYAFLQVSAATRHACTHTHTHTHTRIYRKVNDRQPLASSQLTIIPLILFTSERLLGSPTVGADPLAITANPDPLLQPLLVVSTASVNPTNLTSNHLASSTTSDHLAVSASSTPTHGPPPTNPDFILLLCLTLPSVYG